MKSRSSRLFIVLIHLVGVSRNLPNGSQSGIIGVHPETITSERIDLSTVGIVNQNQLSTDFAALIGPSGSRNAEALFWLQDETDGKCFGPSGQFSDCGDATLWKFVGSRENASCKTCANLFALRAVDDLHVVHKTTSEQGILLAARNQEEALEGRGEEADSGKKEKRGNFPHHFRERRRSSIQDKGECLLGKMEVQSRISQGWDIGKGKVIAGPCTDPEAFGWMLDERGVLRYSSHEIMKLEDTRQKRGWAGALFWNVVAYGGASSKSKVHTEKNKFLCVRREALSGSSLGPCNPPRSGTVCSPEKGCHKEERNSLLARFSVVRYQSTSSSGKQAARNQGGSLKNLSVTVDETRRGGKNDTGLVLSKVSDDADNRKPYESQRTDSSPKEVRRQDGVSPSKDVSQARLEHQSYPQVGKAAVKMPRNKYFREAVHGTWTDPETGLEYPTDLSQYLGRDKDRGKHLLMGVGQYTKTVFKVKVYGVAFYVSQDDVLGNAEYAPFSSMSANKLTENLDFYDLLMKKPSELGGGVERTLLLKLNMQLGTETMRSSLEADWKMLTDDHKKSLISSSFKSREADGDMLNVIQSEDNASRCSCSQSAPAQYEADPSCCVRGTELGFTWTKSGHFEIRINGRMMDTFDDSEMAYGVFYDYLQHEDPISPEARTRFVDGFPSLLAPLSRFSGRATHGNSDVNINGDARPKRLVITDAPGFVFKQTLSIMAKTQAHIIGQVSASASTAGRYLETAVTEGGEAFDRRREKMAEHVCHSICMASVSVANFASRRIPAVPENWGARSCGSISTLSRRRGADFLNPSGSTSGNKSFSSDHNASFSQLPEEMGSIVHPTMSFTHRLFLTTVHLYLMLILILSFPRSTRVVVKRSAAAFSNSRGGQPQRFGFSVQVMLPKDSGRTKMNPRVWAESRRKEDYIDARSETLMFSSCCKSL